MIERTDQERIQTTLKENHYHLERARSKHAPEEGYWPHVEALIRACLPDFDGLPEDQLKVLQEAAVLRRASYHLTSDENASLVIRRRLGGLEGDTSLLDGPLYVIGEIYIKSSRPMFRPDFKTATTERGRVQQ